MLFTPLTHTHIYIYILIIFFIQSHKVMYMHFMCINMKDYRSKLEKRNEKEVHLSCSAQLSYI